MKRKLNNEELNIILKKIYSNIPQHFTDDVKESILGNIKTTLLPQLESVTIYPHLINELIDKIEYTFIRSLIQPGEMVGCIAASSIGEQNTQASLNSFHSSGLFKANLTSGIVRLNELLNATKVIKTPALSIYFDSNKIDNTDLFKIKEICNSDIIFFDIKGILEKYQIDYFNDIEEFKEDLEYYKFYSMIYNNDFINCKYRLRLIFDRDQLYKIKKSIEYIMHTIIGYYKDVTEYCSFVFHPDYTNILDIFFHDVEDPEELLSKQDNIIFEKLQKYINSDNKVIIFIEKIFIPSILSLKISGITGVEECYFNEEKDGTWSIDTKGGDYKEIFCKDFIDVCKSKSNNMWDIFNLLGVEAARSFLLEDFSKIINVSRRHLDTLINSMINTGKIMSVSRYGIDRKQVGPFAKAAFEQPFENFFISATKGEKDLISGVSASVSLGKLAKMGTGMVELYFNDKMTKTELNKLEEQKIKELEIICDNHEKYNDDLFDENYIYDY